jgi:hypothetical protein
MTGAVRRTLTMGLASLLLGIVSSAHAQSSPDAVPHRRSAHKFTRIVIPPPPPAPDPVPPEISERRHDGHMSPDERRQLRQHIEDAVRELYKR